MLLHYFALISLKLSSARSISDRNEGREVSQMNRFVLLHRQPDSPVRFKLKLRPSSSSTICSQILLKACWGFVVTFSLLSPSILFARTSLTTPPNVGAAG